MPRTDPQLDAMLRHLGAAYYDSLYGRATRADVTRAVGTVAESLNEGAARPGPDAPDARSHDRAPGEPPPEHGWARKVSDVMTTSVVTVDRATPYKQIARLLAEHRVSGVPVLKMGRKVAGVVTEADLLAAEDETRRRLHGSGRWRWRHATDDEHPALTAGTMMTSPAITIGPHATVPAAARAMNSNRVRLLPVVDDHGTLLGVVSRGTC